MPRGTHVGEHGARLEFDHTLALQIGPGFPLLEAHISGSASKLQVFERCQARVDTLCVFREGLANLGYEAAGRRLAKLGKQLPGFENTRMPAL